MERLGKLNLRMVDTFVLCSPKNVASERLALLHTWIRFWGGSEEEGEVEREGNFM